MLVRVQSGFVNLATIGAAELPEDGGVTLRWDTRSVTYTDADAKVIRTALAKMAGEISVGADEVRPAPRSGGHAPATTAQEEPSASPALKLHAEPHRHAVSSDETDGSNAEPEETALARRADLVMAYEPLASLSHKVRGSFLTAIANAGDFNHLPPKYRKLLQAAEAARRAEQRR